jgi:hypothetical protein
MAAVWPTRHESALSDIRHVCVSRQHDNKILNSYGVAAVLAIPSHRVAATLRVAVKIGQPVFGWQNSMLETQAVLGEHRLRTGRIAPAASGLGAN